MTEAICSSKRPAFQEHESDKINKPNNIMQLKVIYIIYLQSTCTQLVVMLVVLVFVIRRLENQIIKLINKHLIPNLSFEEIPIELLYL